MIETKVCRCLFLLALLDAVLQIQPSLHEHNNAFVQDDSDVQYLLDNIPKSMHKSFASSVHGAGNSISDDNVQDFLSHIEFEPNILDFKERQLGVPHQEIVTLFNRDDNRTIHLSSISGNTQHFHSSFFKNKVIPPLGNTTFNVVFLGREEGDIDSYLFIHTSDGILKYQVRGVSVSSPYRLRPVVGVKLPLNASFTPLIYMHNPHAEAMQVVEVFGSGEEFQLELPSGEVEAPQELWEIPPYQTRPVIRVRFNAYTEKNHTAYIRFKINNSAEVLVVAVGVEVGSGAGLHWGGSAGVVNFGIGGSLHPPIHYPIVLKNSAKKPIKVLNIISTPVSKALKINFEPVVIPGDTDTPIAVGTLVYDWKAGLDLKHFKGKLLIKGVGPGGSSQKLAIPWVAEVLQGGLDVNASVHYCAPHSGQPRNFSAINKFKLPLAITNVSLSSDAISLFTISNFIPKILKPGQKDSLFSLSLIQDKQHENLQMESSILIHSNVSTTEVPLLSYNGKLRKIIPGERESDKGTMNFGTVSSGTESEGVFALENQNPVNIELHGWGVNMPGAVLELMGCQRGPTELFNRGVRNITACSVSGNQSIKPGHLAIFKIKVKTPSVEDDTIGDVFVRTTYERLTVPVYMRVAHGRISLKKLTFTDCFPGSICNQQVKVHSTFSRSMEVTTISPVQKDDRVKYIPLEETASPVIAKGDNHIGSIVIDPSVTCKQDCYLGLPLNSSMGNQWLNTASLPSHTRDSDLNLLNTRYARYLNTTSGGIWDNITMQLDTTEVRGHKFSVNMKPCWPSLLVGFDHAKNKSVLSFPLTQVANTSYKTIKLHNPSTSPLLVHLVMDWIYPQGMRLYHLLPNRFKPVCNDCPPAVSGEFKFEDSDIERKLFEKEWGVTAAMQSVPLVLRPDETRSIRLSYTPSSAAASSALLYIRNNMTILETLRLVGRGAHAQFKFGNRKPGSTAPLLFELTDKHLKDCERERLRRNPFPNLTAKRSFTARNIGELPIEVYSFYISGLSCEGYGFKVLNCMPFTLHPNATRKVEIAFTPDFTQSRVERELVIMTSLGNEGREVVNGGMMKLTLLITLPTYGLEACSAVIARPSWEQPLHWTAICISIIMMFCVLLISCLEADRILRSAFLCLTRDNPVQPPLDLRVLSQSTPLSNNHKDKDERNGKANKKEDTSPDWSLMNVRKSKDKESHKGIKIPDWSLEEERRFRLDTESKEAPFKRSQEASSESSSHGTTRKRNSKTKNNGSESSTTADPSVENSPTVEAQPSEKKFSANSSRKSSPTSNRKGKSSVNTPVVSKEELKVVDNEALEAAPTTSSTKAEKSESKRKQSTSSNGSTQNNNNGSCKKYETNTSQKPVQFSEEETSSTTTESSVHEDNTAFKDCESNCIKADKPQRKPVVKKNKQQGNATVPSLDYKDNYEGDCDDDEYDKERQDNPNRWKTSTNRSTTKHHHHHHHHLSRFNTESSHKLPRQKQVQPRKEKGAQKRRSGDKNQSKATNGYSPKEEPVKQTQAPVITPLPPPPPSCWGENRARFSDVVARNQENLSPISALNNKSPKTLPNISTVSYGSHLMETIKKQPREDNVNTKLSPANIEESLKEIHTDPFTNHNILGVMPNNHHNNSYFMNSFAEPIFEPELVPYDDLPETDEPLVELESTEEDTRCMLWNDSSPMLKLITENQSAFPLEPAQPVEKITNLSDSLKDNWVTVETNWEPLYTRGAVGEERSGVWGVNTGGVWAASPWGASTLPTVIQPCALLPQREPSIQERSGFDPFRSLSTIWAPSSTDTWTSKPKE